MTRSSHATNGSGSSSGPRPGIGITASIEDASFGAWNVPSALVPYAYVRAVEDAGGRAFVLPPSEEGVGETLEALDGIVLSGGSDVDPSHYGADPHPATVPDRPERDRFELRLLEAALDRDMPVLAVCRGVEVLNVARGGDLVQHLPELVGHDDHRHTPGLFADHDVRLEPGSRAAGLVGERASVKSHHHQALGRLGSDLTAVGWAEDGTVEAVEDPSCRFLLGVLWHPEEDEDRALFQALVEQALAYRRSRRS